MFQLSSDEDGYLKSQNATSSRTRPFAFTELGVAMLSSVLTFEVAIQVNVKIMRAFAQMRRSLASNSHLFLRLDLKRHNAQYPAVAVKEFGASHDRFLAIDDTVYHVGASLKDLGRKWFAFSRMEDLKPVDLLAKM